jgi:YebC/PmpR family DNA-binding regulatory protein
MSGHSKWSKIKRQKGVDDAKRGQLYTKLTREIIVAVREGGSNPESNFRLRLAVQRARDSNMPNDNIQRAIKKGSGELEGGATLVEMTLEGYAPGGAAIMVKALSDNRNRTLQEVRSIFSRNGGNLGESGSVSWIFEPRGLITVNTEGVNVDDLTLQAIDAGADDVKAEDGSMEIYTRPEDWVKVREALAKQNVPIASTDLTMTSKTMVELPEKAALQTMRLLEKLEELDEVQNVTTNADFPEAVLKAAKVA